MRWKLTTSDNTVIYTNYIPFEIYCLHPITNPYVGETQILTRVAQGSSSLSTANIILKEYGFPLPPTSYCNILSYVINPVTPGVNFFLDCTSLTPPLPADCRKIVFSTSNIATYDFIITVNGDDGKTEITPQILIKVGC